MQDGRLGQVMMTTAGVSSASTSSMVMMSVAVMAPLANSVIWDMEILLPFTELVGSPRPGGVTAPTGPLLCLILKSPSCVCTVCAICWGPAVRRGDEPPTGQHQPRVKVTVRDRR
jgi:hypothetical protein